MSPSLQFEEHYNMLMTWYFLLSGHQDIKRRLPGAISLSDPQEITQVLHYRYVPAIRSRINIRTSKYNSDQFLALV